jgi:DNA-binding response OmpR family regulator
MKSILVIEKDRVLSRLLCQFLRQHDFHALEAINPEHGFSLVRDRYPDLVICSFELLAFDGTKCATDRENCDTFSIVNIPWILLVAETSTSNLYDKIALSEVTILKKPVRFDLILAVTRDELSQSLTDNICEEISSILKRWYYIKQIESLFNHEQKNRSGKLRCSLNSSNKPVLLNRRHILPSEKLWHNLKIKLDRN